LVDGQLVPERQDLKLHGELAAKGKSEEDEKETSGRHQGGKHQPDSLRAVDGAHSAGAASSPAVTESLAAPGATSFREGQALQDEHLLAQSEDLAVTIITEEAGKQGGERGRQ